MKISCHGYEIWGQCKHVVKPFLKKIISHFFRWKSEHVDKKQQSLRFISYSTCLAWKSFNFCRYLIISFWVKFKMVAILAAILDNVTGPQKRHNPKYVPHLVQHITGYLTKSKSFLNIVTQNTKGGGSINTSTMAGVLFCLNVWGLSCQIFCNKQEALSSFSEQNPGEQKPEHKVVFFFN